jgi:hypothetical protein
MLCSGSVSWMRKLHEHAHISTGKDMIQETVEAYHILYQGHRAELWKCISMPSFIQSCRVELKTFKGILFFIQGPGVDLRNCIIMPYFIGSQRWIRKPYEHSPLNSESRSWIRKPYEHSLLNSESRSWIRKPYEHSLLNSESRSWITKPYEHSLLNSELRSWIRKLYKRVLRYVRAMDLNYRILWACPNLYHSRNWMRNIYVHALLCSVTDLY